MLGKVTRNAPGAHLKALSQRGDSEDGMRRMPPSVTEGARDGRAVCLHEPFE